MSSFTGHTEGGHSTEAWYSLRLNETLAVSMMPTRRDIVCLNLPVYIFVLSNVSR